MKHYITDADTLTWEGLLLVCLITAAIFGTAIYKAVRYKAN